MDGCNCLWPLHAVAKLAYLLVAMLWAFLLCRAYLSSESHLFVLSFRENGLEFPLGRRLKVRVIPQCAGVMAMHVEADIWTYMSKLGRETWVICISLHIKGMWKSKFTPPM